MHSSFAIDHRTWKTGLPVRSAVLKSHAGWLVVGWVTTSESQLLSVFTFFTSVFELILFHDIRDVLQFPPAIFLLPVLRQSALVVIRTPRNLRSGPKGSGTVTSRTGWQTAISTAFVLFETVPIGQSSENSLWNRQEQVYI